MALLQMIYASEPLCFGAAVRDQAERSGGGHHLGQFVIALNQVHKPDKPR
ncbi:hypothetical protein SAMN04487859_102175 [Roseovarius lutimaris]|uniref:Uncharacterized protein n=1 Tax=Roseovarius lutimaris TaxID=1005928 RepID=A0A1I4YZA8_9RHOB|nr:hypothetical protein SAMN04487859_102175 [Roseovarius lutimaris]